MQSCYFCGKEADGPCDHIPPEVFFRGTSRGYKVPEIATVPSCSLHNAGTSAEDEASAFIISDAGARSNFIAQDVHNSLMTSVNERVWSAPSFSDSRLNLLGIRLLRNAEDFDGDVPKEIIYDKALMKKAEASVREKWRTIQSSVVKISAGAFYLSTGKVLGEERAARLCVVAPEFKQVSESVSVSGLDIEEPAYFQSKLTSWGMPTWERVTSGNPDVFYCEIAIDKNRRSWFAIRIIFYRSVRFWVTSE